MNSIKNHKIIHVIKKSVKFSLGFVEFFLAFILFYFTIALTFMSIGVGEDLPTTKGVTIYMKSDGIHTDFVFPVHSRQVDWTKLFPPSDTRGKNDTLKYISVGWGDQGFFLNTPEWSDLKASTAFEACFYLGETAIHTNYLSKLNGDYQKVELNITPKQYRNLYRYVRTTLQKDKHQKIICIHNRGYWDTDSFYEANGSYGMFFTCNSWVNKGLKEVDLPACLWAPFNGGIFHKYR